MRRMLLESRILTMWARGWSVALGAAIYFALALGMSRTSSATGSSAESEKAKAMKSLYPNDFGPDKIDGEIKDYPANIKEGYRLTLTKCGQCHTAARPLNSRFVELEGGLDEALQKKNMEKLKAASPQLFKDQSVWQVDVRIWSRYVNRMMAKPGCKIEKVEGKKIYEFLVYDSLKRKTGANAKKWEAHRKSLIRQLKDKQPARYKELAEQKDL